MNISILQICLISLFYCFSNISWPFGSMGQWATINRPLVGGLVVGLILGNPVQGTIIGVVGTLLGYVLGIGLALLLQRYQFIKLPPGVYTLDHLPILLNWVDIVVVGVSAMTLCFLATIYPARQASSLEPAEALRFE